MEQLWHPPAVAEQTGAGWALSDRLDTVRAVAVIVVVGVIFGGVGAAIAIGGGSAFGWIFVAVAVFLMGTLVRQARILSRWRPGQLTFSQWPLELGGRYSAQYARLRRRGSVGMISRLEARLELAEVVRYTVGTDTETDKEVVLTTPLQIHGAAHGDRLEATVEVEIPSDGPPSFDLHNNRIEWWVIIDFETTDGTEDDSRFKLAVEASRR